MSILLLNSFMELLVDNLLNAHFPNIVFLPDSMVTEVVSEVDSAFVLGFTILQVNHLLRAMEDGVDDFEVLILFMDVSSEEVLKDFPNGFKCICIFYNLWRVYHFQVIC